MLINSVTAPRTLSLEQILDAVDDGAAVRLFALVPYDKGHDGISMGHGMSIRRQRRLVTFAPKAHDLFFFSPHYKSATRDLLLRYL